MLNFMDIIYYMSRDMRIPTATSEASYKPAHMRRLIRAVSSHFNTVQQLTEQHLKFGGLKRACTGSYKSILVKMPHYWKSHVAASI